MSETLLQTRDLDKHYGGLHVTRNVSISLESGERVALIGPNGAGNGILTIAKGTLPLAFFGPAGYGERQGLMMAPARVAQAFAPLLFGLLIDGVGAAALWVTSLLGVAALAALWMLRPVVRQ